MFEGQDFASLIINLNSSKQTAIDWINSHSYHWTEWGWDGSGHPIFYAYNDYCNNSTGIPQTCVIDADANVRYAKLGAIYDNSTLIAVINELL